MTVATNDELTVTCQSSLPEYRAFTWWLMRHHPGAFQSWVVFLAYLIVVLVASWLGSNSAQASGQQLLAGFLAFVAIFSGLMMFSYIRTLLRRPKVMWKRGTDTPTLLTVSDSGIAYVKDGAKVQADWGNYLGYAQLSSQVLLVGRAGFFIIPRSSMSVDDFDRVVAVVARHLQPTTRCGCH
jgi:hypothetical protein